MISLLSSSLILPATLKNTHAIQRKPKEERDEERRTGEKVEEVFEGEVRVRG